MKNDIIVWATVVGIMTIGQMIGGMSFLQAFVAPAFGSAIGLVCFNKFFK